MDWNEYAMNVEKERDLLLEELKRLVQAYDDNITYKGPLYTEIDNHFDTTLESARLIITKIESNHE